LVLQEFMIVPIVEASISDKLRLSCEFLYDLKEVLQSMKHSTNVGDEGGFAPMLYSSHDALDLLMRVMEKSKYEKNFRIAIDAAASTFYNVQSKTYDLYDDEDPITCSDVVDFYDQLIKEYPIISIEDPLSEEDETGWKEITKKLGDKIMLVGDDLFVTNVKKLQHGIDNKLGNAILIKPNQIGTLTETMMAVNLARLNNYDIIVSHRSGETEDTSLAHIAIGLRASYIKAGATCRSERVAKYNELIRIME
jgi:enolase